MAKKDAPGKQPAAPDSAAQAFSRQLRITAFSSFFALAAIIMVTVAWFAMNRNVSSSGIVIDVQADPNLIIAASDMSYLEFKDVTASRSLPLSSNPSVMKPARHDSTWNNYANGLKKLSSNAGILDDTGLRTGAYTHDTLGYSAVSNGGDTYYYIDYVVRIASSGSTLSADGLYVSLEPAANALPENPTPVPEGQEGYDGYLAALTTYRQKMYRYAASVDFYVQAVPATAEGYNANLNNGDYVSTLTPGDATYKGTLNLAGKYYADSSALSPTAQAPVQIDVNGDSDCADDVDRTYKLIDGSVALELLNSTDLASGIPWNNAASGNCCYLVTMRFYFDGELLETAASGSETAYVHTKDLTPGNFGVTVHFYAPAA